MPKLTPEQLLELADNFHDRVFSINQTQQLFDHILELEEKNARYKEALDKIATYTNTDAFAFLELRNMANRALKGIDEQ